MSDKGISAVTVVGAGYMGGGIAQVFALAGFDVTLADADADAARRARDRIVAEVSDFEARGLVAEGSARRVRAKLSHADAIGPAVAGAHYVTEAVPESLDVKRDVLGQISDAAGTGAIIASNTSALSISDLAQAVVEPARFLGVHWMNPAPFIPGVELVAGEATSVATVEKVERLISSIGKVPVRVADTPGFVANRLQFALYKEAVQMVEDGVATPTQIDTVVRNSFGFRLALFGPFAIGDMAGLDVYASSYATLERAFGERFAAPSALRDVVAGGNFGLKSGRGFLDIDPADREALLAYRAAAYARLSLLRSELGDAPGL